MPLNLSHFTKDYCVMDSKLSTNFFPVLDCPKNKQVFFL